MSKIQDIIDNVQRESGSKGESRISSLDWTRYAADAITAAFRLDPCLRLQAAGVISDAVFTIETGVDPVSVEIPATLEPYRNGLEAYVEWRYHASSPTNDAEASAAAACYNRFLTTFGATQKA
jgi:hypothetical protein